MSALDEVLIPSLRFEEIASDGSTLTNPAADSRRLFLGEDGLLHWRDSAGTITDVIGPGVADILDLTTAEMDDTLVLAPDGSGGVEFRPETGGVGGSGGVSDLLLDFVPGSPDADDDEFPGSSLDGAWTDPCTSAAGQTNTITVANGWLVLEPATAGSASTGKRVFGIRKAAPAGSFTVSAKYADGDLGSDVRPGVFVGVSGGLAHVCGPASHDGLAAMAIGVSGYSESADWGAFDGFLPTTGLGIARHMGWYRIRWDAAATTLYFDHSRNGVLWVNFSSRAAMSQPTAMGLCLYSNGGSIPANRQMAAGWFRVIDGSAAF